MINTDDVAGTLYDEAAWDALSWPDPEASGPARWRTLLARLRQCAGRRLR